MLLQEYIDLKLKKGTIHRVKYARTLEKKDVTEEYIGRITKETVGRFRIGVTYANMSINKDKKTGSLPYGTFEYGNEIIYSEKTKTHQLRLTSLMNGKTNQKTRYLLDGVEYEKQQLIDMGVLKVHKTTNFTPSVVYNIKLDNIIEIK